MRWGLTRKMLITSFAPAKVLRPYRAHVCIVFERNDGVSQTYKTAVLFQQLDNTSGGRAAERQAQAGGDNPPTQFRTPALKHPLIKRLTFDERIGAAVK